MGYNACTRGTWMPMWKQCHLQFTMYIKKKNLDIIRKFYKNASNNYNIIFKQYTDATLEMSVLADF